jgi:hypothetical protein
MKSILVLTACCLIITSAFSQKSVYNEKISYTYFDQDWGEIPSMDGATYVRVFMGLDSIRPYYAL